MISQLPANRNRQKQKRNIIGGIFVRATQIANILENKFIFG